MSRAGRDNLGQPPTKRQTDYLSAMYDDADQKGKERIRNLEIYAGSRGKEEEEPPLAMVIKKQFNKSSGEKTSGEYVDKLKKYCANLEDEEWWTLWMFAKKAPMTESEYKEVVAQNLDTGKQALISQGVSPDIVENSKARLNYKGSAAKVEKILRKHFWDKNAPIDCLTWSTLLQMEEMVLITAVLHHENDGKISAGNVATLYCSAFWSNIDFNTALGEMEYRHKVSFMFLQKFKGSDRKYVEINERGSVTSISDDLDVSKYRYTAAAEEDRTHIASLLKGTYWPDVRKLLQNKDYKIARGKSRDTVEFKMPIVVLMKEVIEEAKGMGCSIDDVNYRKVAPVANSVFSQSYYKARSYLHTFTRTLKYKMFPRTGGRNSRTGDEDTIMDVYDVEWKPTIRK